MKKIVGIIHPFDLYQTFYVYEDGNKLEIVQTTIKDIPKVIFELSETYKVDQIDLSGATHFSKGLIQQIQKEEMTRYNKNKLIMNCI